MDTSPQAKPHDSKSLKQDRKLVKLLRDALENSADEDGWAFLGAVGSLISKQAPPLSPVRIMIRSSALQWTKLGAQIMESGMISLHRL